MLMQAVSVRPVPDEAKSRELGRGKIEELHVRDLPSEKCLGPVLSLGLL
jgi:hypothetical protein